MDLKVQKRLVSSLKKCSPRRVKLDSERLEDIKESITRKDIASLIKDRAIIVRQKTGSSRVRARRRKVQKAKGRQKGHGSRKGSTNARSSQKAAWINRIRKQKRLLKQLRDKKMVTTRVYRKLYGLAKGGYFRSLGHIKGYIKDQELIENVKK